MAVSLQDAKYIAELAHLQFSEKELNEITAELNEILEYMSKLNSIDTEGVEPLAHPVEMAGELRPDEPQTSLDREKALENAPSRDDEFFLVPKVIR